MDHGPFHRRPCCFTKLPISHKPPCSWHGKPKGRATAVPGSSSTAAPASGWAGLCCAGLQELSPAPCILLPVLFLSDLPCAERSPGQERKMESNEESFVSWPQRENHAPVQCPHPSPGGAGVSPCGQGTCHAVPCSPAKLMWSGFHGVSSFHSISQERRQKPHRLFLIKATTEKDS